MKNLKDWDYLELRDLSKSAAELAGIIGFSEAKLLLQNMPLTGIYIHKNIELALDTELKVLQPESIRKLVDFYGGVSISPTCDRALTRARNRRIRLNAKREIGNFASKTKYYAKVAKAEGLCLSHVREIIYNN